VLKICERIARATMGDLEETIFQRNVPGKYSKWDDVDKNEFHDEPTEKYRQQPDEYAMIT